VVAIRTDLEPERLLDLCKRIERERGRLAGGPRHGPRPLDVDILLLGEITVGLPRLTIPHAAITERRFVLEPLLELDPAALLPDGTELADVLAGLEAERVERVGRLGAA
jgi:2-amino-4-hydroxy-6-hydroxymethyldihydropteridine diphosphokinase